MAIPKGQTVGWQGVKLDVFEDWSVVGFGGDSRLGSMRIDAGGDATEETISGVELRWSVAKGRQSVDTLEARIKPLLRAVEKARKKSGEGEPVIRPFHDRIFYDRDVSIDFKWKTERAGHGRIFHCEKCGRIVVAQTYGRPGQEFNRLSKVLLDSIQCHSATEGYTTWGLYGLLLDVPSDFDLVQQQLMNVYLQLKFQRKGSTDVLLVEQWSLANIQLKGAYLDEWYDIKSVGWTDGVVSDKMEDTVNQHPALSITGRKESFPSMLIETAKQYSKFKRPALNYNGILWECPESNKAYMIQSFTRKIELSPVAECAARTICHVGQLFVSGNGGQ